MCIAVKYGIWNVSKPEPAALRNLRAAGYPELAARVLVTEHRILAEGLRIAIAEMKPLEG